MLKNYLESASCWSCDIEILKEVERKYRFLYWTIVRYNALQSMHYNQCSLEILLNLQKMESLSLVAAIFLFITQCSSC